MIKLIDSISEFTGKLAAWMFFAIGLFVTYEVVMRYVFTLPTIWVDEVSRILQIWATFLAAAFVLKHRDMILIEVVKHMDGTPEEVAATPESFTGQYLAPLLGRRPAKARKRA